MKTVKWKEKKVLPEGRADPSLATYKNRIYVFGGYNPNGKYPKKEVFIFLPEKNTWEKGQPMPTARWGMISIEVDGRIFVFGGYNKTELDIVEVYDPMEDQWETKSSMPFRGQGLMGVQLDGRVHLFFSKLHFEYDPEKDKYSRKSDIPTPRAWGVAAVVDGKIYVIGGIKTCSLIPISVRMKLGKILTLNERLEGVMTNTNTVEMYIPERDKWKKIGFAPFRLFGMGRENPVLDDKIYCTHGQGTAGHFYATCYAYDPIENLWEKLPNAKYPRDGVGCSILDRELYVIGGRDSDPPKVGLNYNEVLVLK
jgi:N-acetylneuraminic acid mutarotase